MHPENEPPVLMSDRRKKRIRRVVGNVLTSALTFVAVGGLWLVVNLIER